MAEETPAISRERLAESPRLPLGRLRAYASPLDRAFTYKMLSGLAILGFWTLTASFFPVSILPGPDRVARKIVDIVVNESFLFHMSQTLMRVTVGFSMAMAFSLVVGIAMGVNRRVEAFFEGPVLVGLAIPGLMWSVMALMWFGIHETAAFFAVFIITAPVVTMNLWKGTRAIDKDLLEMALAFKATRLAITRHVILPQVLPYVFAATRYGFAYGWKVVVLSEMFGLSNGVGFQIQNSFNSFSLISVMAWTASFVFVMVMIEYGFFKRLEDWSNRWRAEISL